MNNAKFGHPNRKLLVAPISRVKNQTVTWAVHGFEGPFLLLDVEQEHVIFVVLQMARGLPDFAVVHVGRNHYDIIGMSIWRELGSAYLPGILAYSTQTADIVSLAKRKSRRPTYPHQLKERIINARSVGKEEAASRAKIIEKEQFLLFCNFPMIPPGSLLQELLVVRQLLLIRE
jgi:hypothetical protein